MVNRVLRSTSVPIALGACGAQDQISFPVPGHCPIVGFGGTLADGEHVIELAAPFAPRRGSCGRHVWSIGVYSDRHAVAAALDVEALVDRFVAHPCQLSSG